MSDLKVRVIPHKRANVAWNLALEEALFLKAKQDLLSGKQVQPIVKLYSFTKPSVVLGYMQKINEVDLDFCDQNKINVTMRTTGGGSVYLERDELQYSLILPLNYSKEVLERINKSICIALQDVGFNPNLAIDNNHPVIRMDGKSFVFDAQRRFKNLLLHHGTTMVQELDHELQANALKATKKEIKDLQKGMFFLRNGQQLKEKQLIKSFEKNLPQGASIFKKDFTNEEIKLAKQLYKNFYKNKEAFSKGKKQFGICYLPSTDYDMEKYAEEDKK
ncbi:MAG: lipoate--protein ligase family protein [Candidatus Woesearchaeota archaeon]|nr:MAG: lipoate--protein ligase family protein [Candidatus Woesearchaeota archaeon]